MPNDISYPYRPPLIFLFASAFMVAVVIIIGLVFSTNRAMMLSSRNYGTLALLGFAVILAAYVVFTTVVAAYFCWMHKTAITLRQSDIILPVGLTQRETAFRYDEIAYAEKTFGSRGSQSLRIVLRTGREFMISEYWLPNTTLADLQEQLQSCKRNSEHNSDD